MEAPMAGHAGNINSSPDDIVIHGTTGDRSARAANYPPGSDTGTTHVDAVSTSTSGSTSADGEPDLGLFSLICLCCCMIEPNSEVEQYYRTRQKKVINCLISTGVVLK